jgi:hypothetical protein
MLRMFLLVIGVLFLTAGITLFSVQPAVFIPAAYATFIGGILICGIILERWRYRKPSKDVPDGWQETTESFLDPLTGKRLRVFYHAETGERKYVEIEAVGSDTTLRRGHNSR